MDLSLVQYTLYLLVCVCLTVWVARTLQRNGRRFLVDVFGDQGLADSVNHLLAVGFYLVNLGVVALLVNAGASPDSPAAVVRTVTTNVGLVLLVLGGMHFMNLLILSRMRRRTLSQAEARAHWYAAQRAQPAAPVAPGPAPQG